MIEPALTVDICTHHYVIRRVTPRGRPAVLTFAKRYVLYKKVWTGFGPYRKVQQVMDCVYGAATKDRREYRFHINTLQEFKDCLAMFGLTEDLVEWRTIPIPKGDFAQLPILPMWNDRDHQIPVIAYLTDPGPPRQKLVPMQTGKGKSYCCMRAMSILAVRTMFILKAQMLSKWLVDLRKTFDIPHEQVWTIRKGEELMSLTHLDRSELPPIIMISNTLMRDWIDLYEEHGDGILEMGYGCLPHQIWEKLAIGMRVFDEVHMEFHFMFKLDMYTHVEHSISLSATLLADDAFVERMQEVAYPKSSRCDTGPLDKYIAARSVIFRFNRPDNIKAVNPANKMYSHNRFEKYVMKDNVVLNNYMRLIANVVRERYLNPERYKPGYKCIIFCASVDFCTRLTAFLAKQFPDKDVRRYAGTAGDPYENLLDAEIRVTTVQSAGTGHDIKGLSTAILTVALDSSQSNIQGFGRLREMDDGETPMFLYFVCENFPQHIRYHEKKRKILEERALSYHSDYVGTPL